VPDAPGVVHNACRAALELAILDAFGRALGEPLLPALAGHAAPPARPALRYSLVLASRALLGDRERLLYLRAQHAYPAVKLKAGFGLAADLQHIDTVRAVFGDGVELRLDANRAWSPEEARAVLRGAAERGVRAVEDPLAGDDLEAQLPALAALRADTGVQVILDETVRTAAEAERALAAGAGDVLNLRVSKCGGIVAALAQARAARAAGAAVQLGCQVGETAILSAAGRLLACADGGMRWLEGSNERYKFAPEHYLSIEDLTYGKDAVGPPLAGPGLGITVLPERLRAFTVERLEVS